MGLFVAITVVAVIMVPTLDETSAESVKVTNEGVFYLEKYGTDAEFTAVWDHTDPNNITIDGETVAIPSSGETYTMLLGADGIQVTISSNGVRAEDSTGLLVQTNTTKDMSIVAHEGSFTFTVETTIVNKEITEEFYFIASDGPYVLKSANQTAYIRGSDTVYYISTVAPSPLGTAVEVIGTVDDGFTVTGLKYTVTSSNHVVNATAADGYVDMYEFTGVTFDGYYTYQDTQYGNGTHTMSQFVVPTEIVVQEAGVLNDYRSMIMIIPLIIIAAIVISSIGLVATRRD